MDKLCRLIERKASINQGPVWNEDRDVFEVVLKHQHRDESEQQIKVGRGLIYSSNFQKCHKCR
jgi:hypothetical protein